MLAGEKNVSSGCGIQDSPTLRVECCVPGAVRRTPLHRRAGTHRHSTWTPDQQRTVPQMRHVALHPGNDNYRPLAHAERRNVTPPSANESPDTAWPLAFAALQTAAISPTRNV